jgi:hypothetical protein
MSLAPEIYDTKTCMDYHRKNIPCEKTEGSLALGSGSRAMLRRYRIAFAIADATRSGISSST